MAISLSDYASPKFFRIRSEATLSRDDNARFDAVPYDDIRSWRIKPRTGYNAANPKVNPLSINLNNAGVILPPEAR